MTSFFASLKPATDYPHSDNFDDRYYLEHLGLYETQCVYLRDQQLFEQEENHDGPFVVAEIGFGSALNFLAFFDLWVSTLRKPQGPLIYISYEKYPLHPQDLQKSLEPWRSQLGPEIDRLLEHYKSPTAGLNFLFFGPENILLILVIGDASEQMRLCHFKANHWMLDGFSPAKNPSAWSTELLEQVSRLASPGASLSTFTAASHVRRNLELFGWQVSRIKGFGTKRHRIEARMPGTPSSFTKKEPITIFGSGIAGLSLAYFYHWLGGQSQVITTAHQGASTIPWAYGQFKPRNQWDAEQNFSAQTHQFSSHWYKDLSAQFNFSYAPAPIMRFNGMKQDLKNRFEKGLSDPKYSEILSSCEDGIVFPIGFSLNGSELLNCLSQLNGHYPNVLTFDEIMARLKSEQESGRQIAITCSFVASSVLNNIDDCSMMRGQTSLIEGQWSAPTHERYRFNMTPDGSTLEQHFVGFRAHHRSHLPLFGELAHRAGVFSVYHGSKGFSSAPWCALLLGLKALQIFSYAGSLETNQTYSLKDLS